MTSEVTTTPVYNNSSVVVGWSVFKVGIFTAVALLLAIRRIGSCEKFFSPEK
jgi:hypothetical protein